MQIGPIPLSSIVLAVSPGSPDSQSFRVHPVLDLVPERILEFEELTRSVMV
jgi:hypothetical protein